MAWCGAGDASGAEIGDQPRRHGCRARLGTGLLPDGEPDLLDDIMTEFRAGHLGAPLPSRAGPTTVERPPGVLAPQLSPSNAC
jgi:hypothetical protein